MLNHRLLALPRLLVVPTLTCVFASLVNASEASREGGGYVAHEWGTFTSLQDSQGQIQEGMFHEEDEALPEFVHSRGSGIRPFHPSLFNINSLGTSCHGKGCDFNVVAGSAMTVTQKMETPVIYFYSDRKQSVKVDVDFPGGIITQYYPNASSFSPPIGKVNAIANGHVHWDVEISTDKLSLPEVSTDSIWEPSRQVHANSITVNQENEKFLFYRGLGNFSMPIRVTDHAEGYLAVENRSEHRVGNAFLLKVTSAGGAILPLNEVGAHDQIHIDHESLENLSLKSMDSFLIEASSKISHALMDSGLYPDESLAMVNTWKKSYFTVPGLRVLYVLPREWTDQLLPLSFSPRPASLVRTLVGRIEIMTLKEEQDLLNRLRASFLNHSSVEPILASLGRFAESKLRRVAALARETLMDQALIEFLQDLVKTLS